MSDCIFVQRLLEYILCSDTFRLLAVDANIVAVLLKDRRASKSEELRLREEVLDGLMVFTELATVTLVKDKDDMFIFQTKQTLIELVFVRWIKRDAQFLNGGYNHLIRIVGAFQTTYESSRIRVLFDTSLLEFVELVAGLLVKVFPVNHKHTFLNILVIFEQCRSLETCQRLTASCGMPDEAIARLLRHTVYYGFHSIYLIRAHDQNFLLRFHKHHIAANQFTQCALLQHHI